MTFVRAQELGGCSIVCFVWLRVKPGSSHFEPVGGEYPLVAGRVHWSLLERSLPNPLWSGIWRTPNQPHGPVQ